MKTVSELIQPTLDQIEALRVSMGSPACSRGPTTGCGQPIGACLYDPSCHDEQLTSESIALHDGCIEALYAEIGIRHVGGGMWVTDYYKSEEWENFSHAASELISEYLSFSFWDEIEQYIEWEQVTA